MPAMSCNDFSRPGKHGLDRIVQQALGCDDAVWYRYLLQKDLCGCALSSDEACAVIDGAVLTANEMVQRITAQYGALSPRELAGELQLNLVYAREELQEPYLYMGLYDPAARIITVNDSAVLQVAQFIGDNELDSFTRSDGIVDSIVLHEIFHALEEENSGIYTRSRMLERSVLGIRYKRGLAGASEVAAVQFSKCMADMAYSPCIFERYLLLALGQLATRDLIPYT